MKSYIFRRFLSPASGLVITKLKSNYSNHLQLNNSVKNRTKIYKKDNIPAVTNIRSIRHSQILYKKLKMLSYANFCPFTFFLWLWNAAIFFFFLKNNHNFATQNLKLVLYFIISTHKSYIFSRQNTKTYQHEYIIDDISLKYQYIFYSWKTMPAFFENYKYSNLLLFL